MMFSKIILMALVAMDAANLTSAETTDSLRGYSLTRRKLGKVGKTYPEKSKKSSKKCKGKEKAKGGSKGGSKAKSKAKSEKSGSEDGSVTEPDPPVLEECPEQPVTVPATPAPSSVPSSAPSSVPSCQYDNLLVYFVGDSEVTSFDALVEGISYEGGDSSSSTIKVDVKLGTIGQNSQGEFPTYYIINGDGTPECNSVGGGQNSFFSQTLSCDGDSQAYLGICVEDSTDLCESGDECFFQGSNSPRGECDGYVEESGFPMTCYRGIFSCEECPTSEITASSR